MIRSNENTLLQLTLDVNYLKTRLIPGLDLCNTESKTRRRQDLKELSALHGAQLRVVKKMPSTGVAGLFSDEESRILLESSSKKEVQVDDEILLTSFCHELGHAMQHELTKSIPLAVQLEFYRPFKKRLLFEQTAETTAYYISKNYFPSLFKKNKMTKAKFQTYFSKEDAIFLAKEYEYDINSMEVQCVLKHLPLEKELQYPG